MNNYKIAILITTFLRDNLLYKTIQSIIDNNPGNYMVLIADQGYVDSEKDITIDYYKSQIPLEYYPLAFDCGLSIARNFLVQKAFEMNIPYCLVMSDSIQFTEVYNFEQLFNQLDNRIIINFKLKNIESIALKDIFLAKTNLIGDLWDLEMKIYEYYLAFAECIKRDYKIAWNEDYNFKKIKSRSTEEYQSYCKRIKEYRKLSIQKIKEYNEN
jgi:hypothetical protein